jgi:hypothetical protein
MSDRKIRGEDSSRGGDMATGQDDDVKAFVLKKYSEVTRSAKRQGCGPAMNPCCCGGSEFSPEALATALGYSPDEIALPPKGAHLGLSCGNPLAIAEPRSGETCCATSEGGSERARVSIFVASGRK